MPCAPISFTKGFDVADKWGHALDLINHVNPRNFFVHRPRDEVVNFDPEPVPATGGLSGSTSTKAAAPAVPVVTPRQKLLRCGGRGFEGSSGLSDS